MPETIPVAITFRLNPNLVREIEAVDPRIRVIELSQLGRREPPSPEERQQALDALREAQVIFGPNDLAAEYVDAAPNLKWFQIINAGVDRMAEQGLLSRGFTVTTASGLAAVAIAEYVLGVMLMLTKQLHLSVRHQLQHHWDRRFTPELKGKTVGIVGMGAIGRETARRARAFEMRIIASRRTVKAGDSDPDCDLLLPYSDLDRLLAESDYVVLCVPLTDETRNLIGKQQLAQMKPSGYLVNIARGAVVDQDALIAALKDGTLAGAALDVTEPEPLPGESELWDMENVIVTPHISGAVEGYGTRAAQIFVRNLGRYVRGEELENVVDPVLAY